MITPVFRTPSEAKQHIKRLHLAFKHYEVHIQAHDGSFVPLHLQQVYRLVAQVLGFERWEVLRRALSLPHKEHYLDESDAKNAPTRALSERFAKLLDSPEQVDTINAAILFSGFGLSPAKYQSLIGLTKPVLMMNMAARQLATVCRVQANFSRGARYGLENYAALSYLRDMVLAKYLGRPIPPKPRGFKIPPESRTYEKSLYRYLNMTPKKS